MPADLAERIVAAPDAAALVRQSGSAPEALTRLEEAGLLAGAARLVAHALPAREAVWWACMCADHTARADLPEPDRAARVAAERWVRELTEVTRRVAMETAQAAGLLTPEAWAGVAAFWSGGSMAPAGQPEVRPAPHLCGTAVAGSVLLASVRGDAGRQPARLRRFLASAREIAAGQPGRLPHEDA
jgi:hypothetical protein